MLRGSQVGGHPCTKVDFAVHCEIAIENLTADSDSSEKNTHFKKKIGPTLISLSLKTSRNKISSHFWADFGRSKNDLKMGTHFVPARFQ